MCKTFSLHSFWLNIHTRRSETIHTSKILIFRISLYSPSLKHLETPIALFSNFLKNSFWIYFWERAQAGEEQKERGTEDLKHAPRCWQQWSQCGAWTHKLWDHDLSQSWTFNWLSHPVPLFSNFYSPFTGFPLTSIKTKLSSDIGEYKITSLLYLVIAEI